MIFKNRSTEPEWLDLNLETAVSRLNNGPFTDQEYDNCLKQLGNVGNWLQGDRATFKVLKKLNKAPQSILDIGCGGGYFTKKLAQFYSTAAVLGVDLNPKAIQHAIQNNKERSNLNFEVWEKSSFNKVESYDLILTTLVCHHMSDQELILFLKQAYKACRHAIVINDLHRHVLAYCSFALIAPVLFQNRLISHDGLISIKRGFKHSEWIHYLKEAGIPLENCSIKRHFPFRWTVVIQK